MANTVTSKDLDRIAKRIEPLLRLDESIPADSRLALDHGSKTYGRAFRLHHTGHGGSTAHWNIMHPLLGAGGYLGMTKREAYDRLIDIYVTQIDRLMLQGISTHCDDCRQHVEDCECSEIAAAKAAAERSN